MYAERINASCCHKILSNSIYAFDLDFTQEMCGVIGVLFRDPNVVIGQSLVDVLTILQHRGTYFSSTFFFFDLLIHKGVNIDASNFQFIRL